MENHKMYMRRCFELAKQALGDTSPNPLVGAIIVYDGKIIGEGYHHKCGEAHAEVNAINSVKNQELLKKSTIYVNLEPCYHYGHTPPCVDLILEKQIPRVVICNKDPFFKVNGNSIVKLQNSGVSVKSGVLEKEGRDLNRRFFTFQEQFRPYIILKWAQSVDGFMAAYDMNGNPERTYFSNDETIKLSHQLRAQEDAIMVGTNTVMVDNPQLTTRIEGKRNPLRVVIDRKGVIPESYHIFDRQAQTLIFTEKERESNSFVTFVQIDFSDNVLLQMMRKLYEMKVLSIIVEGGLTLLQSFISAGLWDEIRRETTPSMKLKTGLRSPIIENGKMISSKLVGRHAIEVYKPIKFSVK